MNILMLHSDEGTGQALPDWCGRDIAQLTVREQSALASDPLSIADCVDPTLIQPGAIGTRLALLSGT